MQPNTANRKAFWGEVEMKNITTGIDVVWLDFSDADYSIGCWVRNILQQTNIPFNCRDDFNMKGCMLRLIIMKENYKKLRNMYKRLGKYLK